MIDLKFVYQQISRLRVLPYPVTDEMALKELATALSSAENEFQATDCITEFTQYSDKWPTPADIRRILATTRVRRPSTIDKRCEYCQGTGFKTYALLVTTERRGDAVFKSKDKMIVHPGPESYTTRYLRSKAELESKLGPEQNLYEFADRCPCRTAPAPEEIAS